MEVLKYRVDGTSEWQDIIAIQGKQGIQGIQGEKGQDGKTPVLGEDYFTEDDKNEIKEYCNNYINSQLGVIENGYY